MPPAYTPSQKSAIAQFVSFTSVKESVAAKQLKAQGWDVEQAVDAMPGQDVDYGKGEIYNARARLERALCLLPMHEYGPARIHGLGPPMLSMLDVDEEERCKTILASYRSGDQDFLNSKYDGIAPSKKDFYTSPSNAEILPARQLRRQFISWISSAEGDKYWWTMKDLPALFKLALRRPLITERALRKVLKKLKVAAYLPRSFPACTDWDAECEPEHTPESRTEIHEFPLIWTAEPDPIARTRARDIVRGLEAQSAETTHVSYQYKHTVPMGNNSLNKSVVTWADEAPASQAEPEVTFQEYVADSLNGEELEIIEDIGNSISLFRTAQYTLDETLDILHERLIGLVYDLSKRVADIEDCSIAADILAERIYLEAIDDDSDEADDSKPAKSRRKDLKSIIATRSNDRKLENSGMSKKVIKFTFDIGSRVQRIYQEVLSGGIQPHEAPATFRMAIEKPSISDEELAKLLHKHSVPPDLFFDCNAALVDVPMLDTPGENHQPVAARCLANDVLTPEDSRRSSKLADTVSNSVVPGMAPMTPPEDSFLQPNGIPEMDLLKDAFPTDERSRLLASALQKVADAEPYDCRCIDDLSEEAELPIEFYEWSSTALVQEPNYTTVTLLTHSNTPEETLELSDDVEDQKHSMKDAQMKALSLTGFRQVPLTSLALRPVMSSCESLVPEWLIPGKSIRTRVRHECNDVWTKDRYNPDFRNNNEDWEDHDSETGQRSSSPEDGDTKDLWGLLMPTRTAKELGMRLGLASSYVREKFHSSTRNRDIAKQLRLGATRQLIPFLKRKASSASSGSRKHKSSKFDEEVITFADPGDDHKAFIDKRVWPLLLGSQAARKERCSQCSLCFCTCRNAGDMAGPKSSIDKGSTIAECHAPTQPASNLIPHESSSSAIDSSARSVNDAFNLMYGTCSEYLPPASNPFVGNDAADTDDVGPPLTRCRSRTNSLSCVPNLSSRLHGNAGRSMAELEQLLVTKFREDIECDEKKPRLGVQCMISDVERTIETKQAETVQMTSGSRAELPEVQELGALVGVSRSIICSPVAPELSVLTSASSVNSMLSLREIKETNTVGSYAASERRPPVPLFQTSAIIKTGSQPNSTSANKDDKSIQQPMAHHQRSDSISSSPKSSYISNPQDLANKRAAMSTEPSLLMKENENMPTVLVRKCSVITTMESLKIDDQETPIPLASGSLPAELGGLGVMPQYSNDAVIEYLEQSFKSKSPFDAPDNEMSLNGETNEVALVYPCPLIPPPAPSPRHATIKSLVSQSYFPPVPICADPFATSISKSIERDEIGWAPPQCLPPAPMALKSKRGSNRAPLHFQFTAPSVPKDVGGLISAFEGATMHSESPSSPTSQPKSPKPLLEPEDDNVATECYESCPSLSPSSSVTGLETGSNHERDSWVCKPLCTKTELLAKFDRFLEDIAPRKRSPKVQPQANDITRDFEEKAWANKCSHRVYLWKRREIRRYTNQASRARYFQNSPAPTGKAGIVSSLNKLFDKYRGPYPMHFCDFDSQPLDDPESPDAIGTSGTMRYLTDLSVNLDEPAVLAVLTEVSAPTMGELSRDGFVTGWKALNAESLSKQQASLAHLRKQISSSTDYFRRVYKHTFLLARNPGQKAVALDTALDFWRLLFGKGGIEWRTAGTGGTLEIDWLSLWCEYLEDRWRKSVNKDMWDQTAVFALKSLEDASMSWWSEDGAWPGVLDEFVGYVKERTKARKGDREDGMDIE